MSVGATTKISSLDQDAAAELLESHEKTESVTSGGLRVHRLKSGGEHCLLIEGSSGEFLKIS